MADLVGKTLKNRYRVVESLGRGGMADVYKVWDEERAVYLALKVLRQDLAQDTIFLRRFQREAKALAQLQHPHIVRFYGLERDDLLAFLLMEYVDGISLQGEILRSEGKSLPMEHIQEVMEAVCSALHYAHRQGLVHCDIKPGNILIDKNGQIYLTDFGIARGMDAATSTMVGIGTPAYMAPELIKGEDPTPQTDIYALGIVLYEMLTGGERPFTGERATITGTTAEKVRWEHLQLMPKDISIYNPGISIKMKQLLRACLQKNPIDRPAKVLFVVDVLLNKQNNKTPHFTRPIPNQQIKKKAEDSQKFILHYIDLYEKSIEMHDEFNSNLPATKSVKKCDVWIIRCFSPNIRCANISPDKKNLTIGTMDHKLEVWDIESKIRIHTKRDHTDVVNSAAFSHKGDSVVSGSWNGEIVLWDIERGINFYQQNYNSSGIWCLAFSQDDKYVVSGSLDSSLCVLTTKDLNQIRTLDGHKDLIYCLQFSSKGDVLVSGSLDSTICLWNFPAWKLVNVLYGHQHGIHSLSFSSEGNLLFSGSSDNTIKMWDVQSGSLLHTFKEHRATVNNITYIPEQNVLITCSIDNEMIFWDLSNRTILSSIHNTDGRIMKVL
ncbi:MAG TPA: hypothetical protein DCK95_02385 [Anaerolineaceae bacterium]|nr:hypothetical protein [Anaerolineaceae bacterium]